MRELDRRATEEFHIPSLTLMENAGKAVAEAAEKLAVKTKKILILCGSGNNGADGIVAARYLHNRGCKVKVLLMKKPDKGDALKNYQVAESLWVDMSMYEDFIIFSGYEVIIDALLGTGSKGDITGPYHMAIESINSSGIPVVSVDIPSGLDPDTGEPAGTAVKATITVTMALPKKGFDNPKAKEYLGRVEVADIGIPKELLKTVNSDQ